MIPFMKAGLSKWVGVWLLATMFGFGSLEASNAAESKTTEISSAPAYELAVFPWRKVGVGSDIDDAVWKGLREAVQETGLFSLKYSYYPTKSGRETKMISRDLLNESIEGDLWIRKNAMEWYRPEVSLVSSLAHQLKVDAVLMYSLDHTRHWFTMQVFLVDVRHDRVFDAKVMDSPSRAELLRAPIRGITLKVFREYQESRSQAGGE
ncbi:MAG: hypothetical protein HY788_07330 [Deltaproteobacteria bacterium]|nr:hypothetical protein [Deltaproteobacteria bacterium]